MSSTSLRAGLNRGISFQPDKFSIISRSYQQPAEKQDSPDPLIRRVLISAVQSAAYGCGASPSMNSWTSPSKSTCVELNCLIMFFSEKSSPVLSL